MNGYRHEYKYLISKQQLFFLENELKYVMCFDNHSNNGMYNIRSLYFDDYDNTCFYDNENGTDPREKFRIRIYNSSPDRIGLECKRKENGKTLKSMCLISYEQCKQLMNGKVVDDFYNQDKLIQKLCTKILINKYHPVVIVDYDRKPYVYKNGNVRISFDTNISSSNYIDLFLDKKIPKRAVMPYGTELLEVKYDDFLPDFIYNKLEINSINQTTFSKYYYSRCFELGKNI